MNKFTAAVVAMMMMFTVGCSSASDTPASVVTVTATPEISDPAADEEYAELLRREAPGLRFVPTQDLIKNAETVCDSFDAGMTFREVAETYQRNGFDSNEAGTLIGGAIFYRCPEHSGVLDQYDTNS